jgi:3-hydroxyisobutyrate dehydrogenase-like beta-hydroxyacid dehydrogenase
LPWGAQIKNAIQRLSTKAGRRAALALLPAAAIVDQMFGTLVAEARGDWDHAAFIALIEYWS